MEKDLISVIMPHYKVPGFKEDFLYQALDSLLNQTHKNFEVRLCLDCPEKEYIIKIIEVVEDYNKKGLEIFLMTQ